MLPEDVGLSDGNLRSHLANGHLPLQALAVQHAAQQRANQVADAITPGVQELASHLRLARAVVEIAIQRLWPTMLSPRSCATLWSRPGSR